MKKVMHRDGQEGLKLMGEEKRKMKGREEDGGKRRKGVGCRGEKEREIER